MSLVPFCEIAGIVRYLIFVPQIRNDSFQRFLNDMIVIETLNFFELITQVRIII